MISEPQRGGVAVGSAPSPQDFRDAWDGIVAKTLILMQLSRYETDGIGTKLTIMNKIAARGNVGGSVTAEPVGLKCFRIIPAGSGRCCQNL